MTLDESSGDDLTEEVDGIQFVVQRKLAEKIKVFIIDYRITLTQRDFVITPKSPGD